jgi:peptidoglycan/LPS O-acetylase OafA/YrhL
VTCRARSYLTMLHSPQIDSRRRIPELDGIRGMVIFLVLVWHYGVSSVKSGISSAALYTACLRWRVPYRDKHTVWGVKCRPL